ncbi:hypothetical protein LTR95_012749 [Oleoguttula sp. CCFEE 5521]
MDTLNEIRRMVELIDLCDDDDDQPEDIKTFIEIGEDDDADVVCLGEVHSEGAAEAVAKVNDKRISLQSITVNGQTLSSRGTVELVDGDFLKVTDIFIDEHGHQQLQGLLLRRNKHMTGMLDQKVNELCVITQSSFGIKEAGLADCTVIRPAEEAVDLRECTFTNQPFPARTWRDHLRAELRREDWRAVKQLANEQMLLTCRWRFTVEAERNQIMSESLLRLREHEADEQKSCSDVMLWRTYLEKESKSGTSSPSKRKHDPEGLAPLAQKRKTRSASTHATTITIEDDDVESEPEIVLIRSKSITSSNTIPRADKDAPLRSDYSYGDICTGAGGMASGAVQAGLRMQFALDHDHDACESLSLNFKTRVLEEDVHEFCTKMKVRGYLPHTKPGKNDEQNVATGYAVEPILERCRPRIVTFEQTSGMVSRHPMHFHALVRQLTDAGYSVRWSIQNLADFGNPHARRRLIIIAACPGEPLPQFPAPTHGAGPGKKPYTTIYQCLSRVDYSTVPMHMQQYTETPRRSEYDPHQPLQHAITTSGGQGNFHPNGRRSFMLAELAALQCFRPQHRFCGRYGSIRKQIGNAVPGVFGKCLFGKIAETMREHDKTVAGYVPPIVELD